MSFKPRNTDSSRIAHRKNRPRKQLIVTGEFTMPEKLLGWEVELLAPIVSELVFDMIKDHESDGESTDSAQLPTAPSKKPT